MSVVEAELIQPYTLPGANLTLREKALVEHYLTIKVKWKAAKLAGYRGNMHTLCQTAIDTLNKPEVARYYNEMLRIRHVSADELFAEVSDVLRTPLDVKVQRKTGVRVADKLKAGEMLGKFMGLEKSETDLDQSSIERLADSIISGLFAAAQARQASVQPQLTASPDTNSSSSSSSSSS